MKLLHIAGSVCRHPTRATLLIFLAIVTYMAAFQSDLSSYYEQIKHDIEKRQSSQTYIVSKIHNIMMVCCCCRSQHRRSGPLLCKPLIYFIKVSHLSWKLRGVTCNGGVITAIFNKIHKYTQISYQYSRWGNNAPKPWQFHFHAPFFLRHDLHFMQKCCHKISYRSSNEVESELSRLNSLAICSARATPC